MPPVIPIYKPIGLTPLETLNKLRLVKPELKDEVLAYAGRLDPMAEGVLLVLIGDECKKREVYQQLPKAYEVTGIFGISTDTYDAMGKISQISNVTLENILPQIEKILSSFAGSHKQQYPPYSSARVKGKPLFYWARSGKLGDISIPHKSITISSIEILSSGTLPHSKILTDVENNIRKVTGDFRQEEVLDDWKNQLSSPCEFPFVTVRINSSQGAYMRSIIHEMGQKISTGAIAFHIKRVSVGEYTIEDSIKI